MAEDLTENIIPMDFHPCDTPRGMSYYNMDVLTDEQQRKMNALKIETMRDNQKYLAQHPEIRACVSIITKLVARQRPRTNVHETIAEYFAKSRVDIENEINDYICTREAHEYEATSALNVYPCHSGSHISVYEDEVDYTADDADKDALGVQQGLSSPSLVMSPAKDSCSTTSWGDVDFDIEPSGLQQAMPDSMKNLGVNYSRLQKVSSDKIVQSISVIANTAEEGAKSERSKVRIYEPSKAPEPDESDEGGESGEGDEGHEGGEGEEGDKGQEDEEYTGHIPTIEDYDAGYGRRRRKTFDTGRLSSNEGMALIEGYLGHYYEGEEEGDEEDEEIGADQVSEIFNDRDPIRERLLSLIIKSSSRLSQHMEKSHDDPDMTPLLESRSFRASVSKALIKKVQSQTLPNGEEEQRQSVENDNSNLKREDIDNSGQQFQNLHLDEAVKSNEVLAGNISGSNIALQDVAPTAVPRSSLDLKTRQSNGSIGRSSTSKLPSSRTNLSRSAIDQIEVPRSSQNLKTRFSRGSIGKSSLSRLPSSVFQLSTSNESIQKDVSRKTSVQKPILISGSRTNNISKSKEEQDQTKEDERDSKMETKISFKRATK